MGVQALAVIALLTRSNMGEVLNQEYVATAATRSKEFEERRRRGRRGKYFTCTHRAGRSSARPAAAPV